jgi:hypothetical protein
MRPSDLDQDAECNGTGSFRLIARSIFRNVFALSAATATTGSSPAAVLVKLARALLGRLLVRAARWAISAAEAPCAAENVTP